MAASMEFKDIVDYVSLISGIMAILGLGGLFSWGIAARLNNVFASKVSSVFAYALKTALALILIIPFFEAWKALYIQLFRYFASGAIPLLWDWSHPVATIASYGGSILLIAPTYLIVTACLYLWSLSPVRHVWRAISGAPRAEPDA